jgi:signal transduction histidine kinase
MSDGAIKLLVVEDNPGDADPIRERLGEGIAARWPLAQVGRLDEALRLMARERFDVVLLGLSLPDSHGLDTVRRLLPACAGVAVVVLTGLDDEEVGLAAVREGAQDYLVKGQVGGPLLVRTLRYAAERKRAEEVLRKTEEQLRQAQKMEAVGRLAGGVAHDINNMMTVVTGFSDLLLRAPPRDEQQQRGILEEIKKAGERAVTVARQLLAFSRKQMVQPVVLDLNGVVTGLDKMLRSLVREDIRLTTLLDPALHPVKADLGQIEVVILNLAANARDAMPRGGTLTIETANAELDASFWPNDFEAQPGPYACLAVTDTGSGMDERTRAHLFEPFFTTKEVGKGTGLGLATVYGVVKQSGGQIAVYSEPGRGTTFKIYLPQATETVPAPVSGPEPPGDLHGRETVLLAEDDEGVRRLARQVLEEKGYTLLEARTGAEALDVAGQHPGPIHLLVADTVMPEMNGRELSQRLVRSRPGVKVLYVSGYSENVIVHHGVLDPGIPFLQKPFTPPALLRKVREVLDQAPAQAQA